jgi:hypothetical protein
MELLGLPAHVSRRRGRRAGQRMIGTRPGGSPRRVPAACETTLEYEPLEDGDPARRPRGARVGPRGR